MLSMPIALLLVWAYVCDIYISLSSRWPKHTILPFSSQQAMSHSWPGAAAGGAVRAAVFPHMWTSVCVSVFACAHGDLHLEACCWNCALDLGHVPTRDEASVSHVTLSATVFARVSCYTSVCLCVFDEHVTPTPHGSKGGPPPPLPHVSVTTMMLLSRSFTEEKVATQHKVQM